MDIPDYSIDTSGSPQDVQRKQAMADALLKQGQDSTPAAGGRWGGALTALNRGLAGALGGYQVGQARQEEQQGKASYQQQLAAALGAGDKVSPAAMIGLAGNSWANPAQTQAISHVADMQAQQARQGVEDSHFQQTLALQKEASARAAQTAERTNMSESEKVDERIAALKAHGIDPSSPQGQAFAYNGTMPGDPTPKGFAPNPAAATDPTAPKYVPVSGGPTDPAYLAQVAQAEARAKAASGTPQVLGKGAELYHADKDGHIVIDHKNAEDAQASLDDATTGMMAKQYVAGDKSVLTNLGRGAQGSANIVKLRSAIKAEADAQGLDGNGIAQRMIDYVGDTSRERTAATQEGRMAPAGIEAHGAIQLGRIASDAVPRGNFVPVNRAIQAFQEGTSDPALRAFGSANTTIINTYARAINPNGVGTVADKEHARQMLSTADGPAAYKAVLDQLDKEIEMAHKSPAQARAGFKQEREQQLNGAPPGAPVEAPPVLPAAVDPIEAEMRKRGLLK